MKTRTMTVEDVFLSSKNYWNGKPYDKEILEFPSIKDIWDNPRADYLCYALEGSVRFTDKDRLELQHRFIYGLLDKIVSGEVKQPPHTKKEFYALHRNYNNEVALAPIYLGDEDNWIGGTLDKEKADELMAEFKEETIDHLRRIVYLLAGLDCFCADPFIIATIKDYYQGKELSEILVCEDVELESHPL